MKFSLCAVALLAVTADDGPEKAMKDLGASMRKVQEALGKVKDRESAEAARPALDALSAEVDRSMKIINALKPEERKALLEKNKEVRELAEAGDKELGRLDRLPEAYAVLRKNPVIARRHQAMVSTAKVRSIELAKKVEVYYVNNGAYPPSLEALSKAQPKGGAPVARKGDLLDPWGRRYKFQLIKTDAGEKVKVWSLGHPSEKGKPISNLPS